MMKEFNHNSILRTYEPSERVINDDETLTLNIDHITDEKFEYTSILCNIRHETNKSLTTELFNIQ